MIFVDFSLFCFRFLKKILLSFELLNSFHLLFTPPIALYLLRQALCC